MILVAVATIQLLARAWVLIQFLGPVESFLYQDLQCVCYAINFRRRESGCLFANSVPLRLQKIRMADEISDLTQCTDFIIYINALYSPRKWWIQEAYYSPPPEDPTMREGEGSRGPFAAGEKRNFITRPFLVCLLGLYWTGLTLLNGFSF